MSSSIQSSIPINIVIYIPPELIQSGKTLLIEKYFELFVDGYHLSKPAHFIRQTHGLCLVDTQQQDLRSVTSTHQWESDIDDNQLIQVIIEFSPESLNAGKSVTIEKIDSNEGQKPSGNFEDLYNVENSNQSTKTKDIHIRIPKQSIQRGYSIIIEKGNISVIKTDDYHKQKTHNLTSNPFYKRDHLQSKNLMEMTIEVPPELLNNGQTITFRKEDPQILAANFPYRRHSKPDLQTTTKDNHLH